MDDHNKLPELDNDERNIFLHADGVIKDYQATHKEKVPKCIKMNTDNAELLKNTLRKITRVPATAEITQMRGSQIIIDDQLDLNGIVADDE